MWLRRPSLVLFPTTICRDELSLAISPKCRATDASVTSGDSRTAASPGFPLRLLPASTACIDSTRPLRWSPLLQYSCLCVSSRRPSLLPSSTSTATSQHTTLDPSTSCVSLFPPVNSYTLKKIGHVDSSESILAECNNVREDRSKAQCSLGTSLLPWPLVQHDGVHHNPGYLLEQFRSLRPT